MGIDAVDEDEARLAGLPGVVGYVPEHAPVTFGKAFVHERIARENADVEGADVTLILLSVEILGGDEIVDIGVGDGDGSHPRTTAGSPLADHPQRRGEDVTQRGDRTGVVGTTQTGPEGEVIEHLDRETRGATRGTSRPLYGGTLGPESAHIEQDVLASQNRIDSVACTPPDRLHRVAYIHGFQCPGCTILLDKREEAVTPGYVLAMNQIEVGTVLNLLVIRVARAYGQEQPASGTMILPLRRDEVEAEAVATTDLGHQGELGSEIQNPGVTTLNLGAAILNEAVEYIAMAGGRPGEHAPTWAEPLRGHESEESFRVVGLALTLFGPCNPSGNPPEHARQVPIGRLEILASGDVDSVPVEVI